VSIPLLLLFFGLVALGFDAWVDISHKFAQQERDRSERLLANGARLAGIAQYLAGKNDLEGMKVELELTAAVPDLRLALLCDAADRVLQATKERWRGQPLAASPLAAAMPLAARARATLGNQVARAADGQSVIGAFPYQLSLATGQPQAAGVGVVVVEFDLARAYAIARSDARRKSLLIGAGFLALSLALWGVLHRAFTTRVRRLVEATGELARGNLQARVGLKTTDELGEIARAVDGMAEKLSSQVQTLQSEIAERKQAEKALEENRALMRGIIESAMDAIISVDGEQRIVLFNAAAEQMFGCPAVEATGQPLERFIPARFHDAHRQHVNQFGQTRVTKRTMAALGAIYGLRRSGEEFPAEASISQTGEGARKLYTVILRDISERRCAEARLVEQAALLNQAREAIISCDLAGRVLFWNRGAELMYGWTAEEATGVDMRERLAHDAPEHAPGYAEETRNALYGKGEWAGELRQFTKDGREITVESHLTLVRDEAGQPQSILVINNDITQQRRLEQQFLRAQRLESIGTLAGGIAHDLNNILSPVLMATQMLQLKFSDEESQRWLQVMQNNVERGAAMVKQILLFARGAKGERITLQPKHLVKEIVKLLQETLPKNIAVKFSIPEEPWPLRGDATQLHQVLMNLCVNARDAMPKGGTLTITVENQTLDETYARLNPQARAGRYVLISVADTGTGIPPATLERIFDPFFTTKEHGKGTGLGLATAQGIVKGHEGFINVYSELGRGTKFTLYLPAAGAPAAAQPETLRPQLPAANGGCVLVVDDEAAIREITRNALEAFGYQVLTAADGAEGLALFAANQPRVKAVLTDMMMPKLDGPALIRALKKLDPQVPIVASSGLAEESKAAEARLAGVQTFLAKPYTTEKLLRALAEALEGNKR
jgi:PAS domain S-box-containing protein